MTTANTAPVAEYQTFLHAAFTEIAEHGPDANSEWARRDAEFGRMLQDAGLTFQDIFALVVEGMNRFTSLAGKGKSL